MITVNAGDILHHHHRHHLSLKREDRRDTTDDFTFSFLHSSLFSIALWDLANSRPVHCLPTSSSVCFVFFPLSLRLARRFWPDMTIPLQFASLYDGQEVFVWSDCLPDLGTDFLVGNVVVV